MTLRSFIKKILRNLQKSRREYALIRWCRDLALSYFKNSPEGAPGRYIGTEIDTNAGRLYSGIYKTTGEIIYNDSIKTLQGITQKIDLFINDSDQSADYECAEYQAIKDKLIPDGIILGDNSHVSDRLAQFFQKQARSFIFFSEEPKNHWYPGAGMGISWRK